MKEILNHIISKLEQVDILKTVVCFTVLFVFVRMANKLIDHEVPEANREILIHVLGIIEGAVVSFVSFYFGSSKGSQKKDQMLADSLPKDAK
jgi:uncharacterized membrane protein required for colicin V production